jgi:hypothetical protein
MDASSEYKQFNIRMISNMCYVMILFKKLCKFDLKNKVLLRT